MPIYEYRCGSCGFQKEFLQKISDAPLTDCPECGKPALNKLVTAAGFQLKGSGWYVTDFRNGSKPASTTTSAKADDKPAAGGESKPAAKEESKPASTETAAAKPAPAAESAS